MSERWAVAEMLCQGCGHYGDINVWFVGSEPVECPECGEMLMVPKDAEEVQD